MSGIPLFPAIAPTADPTAGSARAVDVDLLTAWADSDSLIPVDLSVVSTRRLRVLCNQLYSALDEHVPPYGALDDYAAVVNELEQRATQPQQ